MSGLISVAESAAHLRSAAESTAARYVLGVAGPPGGGKSTLAQSLRDEVNRAAGARAAQVAPMDGFHFDNRTLDARGLLARKGEPDTFDAEGFVAALTRLRASRGGDVVRWPAFDRDRDTAVAEGVVFESEYLAIVEGNYLLLDDPAGRWSPVRELLHESWFLAAICRISA